MSTVQEILNDVKDVRYPASSNFTDAQLVTFLNECLRTLWTHFNNTTIASFTTISGQATYTLPQYCLIEKDVIQWQKH